jgi:hypothetical protein
MDPFLHCSLKNVYQYQRLAQTSEKRFLLGTSFALLRRQEAPKNLSKE